jgi:hypothetical protein
MKVGHLPLFSVIVDEKLGFIALILVFAKPREPPILAAFRSVNPNFLISCSASHTCNLIFNNFYCLFGIKAEHTLFWTAQFLFLKLMSEQASIILLWRLFADREGLRRRFNKSNIFGIHRI